MSEALKVGDLRKFRDCETVVEIIAVTSQNVVYLYEESERLVSTLFVVANTTPYQAPEPVKKIVAHVGADGIIWFSFENTNDCNKRDQFSTYTRIELTKEMFGFN